MLGKGNYPRVWKKKLLEIKWNQNPRSQTPIKLQFKSRSALQTTLEKGRIWSIAQGTASSPEEVGSRVQILQPIFLSLMIFNILRLESGEVYLGSQFLFLWPMSEKLKWKDLCLWKWPGQLSLTRKKDQEFLIVQNVSPLTYEAQSRFLRPGNSYAQIRDKMTEEDTQVTVTVCENVLYLGLRKREVRLS